jgi:hypothetical protein
MIKKHYPLQIEVVILWIFVLFIFHA